MKRKLYCPWSGWNVEVCGGYYGQEIDSVSPPLSFSDDVVKIAALDPQRKLFKS